MRRDFLGLRQDLSDTFWSYSAKQLLGTDLEVQRKRQSIVHTSHLIKRQVSDLLRESPAVDRADHFAHDARDRLADRDFGMEARGRR